jgi:hypothetical protein
MSTVERSRAANGARCQPKAALGSQPLKEQGGRKSKDRRRLFQLQRVESPETNDVSISSSQDRCGATGKVGEGKAAKEDRINFLSSGRAPEEPLIKHLDLTRANQGERAAPRF